MIDWALDQISEQAIWSLVVVGMIVVVAVVSSFKKNCYSRVPQEDCTQHMNEVSGVNILVQAMATTQFWIKVACVLVFGGGCLACYRASVKADQDGNKRKSIIFGIASTAILIAGFVIGRHFGIFPTMGTN